MTLPQARPFTKFLVRAPYAPDHWPMFWSEEPSPELILENLRRHAEIASVGRIRFPGSLAQKNRLWREYRNFLRQALSNFDGALSVSNRSACLLYYYAMLNFAKAELLSARPANILKGFVHHGLSFKPAGAKTVSGDHLTVKDGVFPWLYELRTGKKLTPGTRLPIARLLRQIPEIGTQVIDANLGIPRIRPFQHAVVASPTESWTILLMEEAPKPGTATARLFRKNFQEVQPVPNWQVVFSMSQRVVGLRMFQSLNTVPISNNGWDFEATMRLTLEISDIISRRTSEMSEASLSPSLYESKMMVMPPALARYAVTYYASSLVRYKPSSFDFQLYPAQAILFDSIARECALPMLIDTISGLEGRDHLFNSSASLRA
ncbi:YaaC family protein [Streptomyces murinus]|uniref:YaaC family protein n=1 Tax=Streptomyces murinus TaxID=33900 RepID=UPI00372B1C32